MDGTAWAEKVGVSSSWFALVLRGITKFAGGLIPEKAMKCHNQEQALKTKQRKWAFY